MGFFPTIWAAVKGASRSRVREYRYIFKSWGFLLMMTKLKFPKSNPEIREGPSRSFTLDRQAIFTPAHLDLNRNSALKEPV